MNNLIKDLIKKPILLMIMLLAVSILASPVSAERLELDSVSFDPAVIAAGDEVDINIQFHAEKFTEDRISDPDYKFIVKIMPDDTLTKDYVIVQDEEGDDIQGTLFSGQYYNRRFRVKVLNNAPAGNYEFKLQGEWFHNGVAEGATQSVKFKMAVKKEGIILDISTIETVPSEVRPGDNFVNIMAFVENVGQKDAKSAEITLTLPEGLESSYSNNNRIWVGRVNAGESKETTFFLDVDEKAESKVYDIVYNFKYMDLDDNQYSISKKLPFLVKQRPYLEVVESSGEGLAGESSKLLVKVKNTGEESAEAVDVRILKQNSQPFVIDVRSDYIGELEPGEEGLAIFDIKVNKDAESKNHDFKILIRSKGDSDEGDDNIYTYNRRASFKVTGRAKSNFTFYAIIAAIVILMMIVIRQIRINMRRKRK